MEYGALSIDTNALRHKMFTVIKFRVASFKHSKDGLQGVPSKLRIINLQWAVLTQFQQNVTGAYCFLTAKRFVVTDLFPETRQPYLRL